MIGMESSRIKTSKVNEVVGKFECRPREFEGIWYKIVSVIAISMSLFHLYTAGFGVWEAIRQRAVHLTFALVLVFLLYPATPRSDKSKPSPVDMLLALAAIGSIGYMALFSDEVAMRGFFLLPQDYIAGIIGTILVFEACRRAVGKELALVGLVFLAYTFFGQYLPGTFGHTVLGGDVSLAICT